MVQSLRLSDARGMIVFCNLASRSRSHCLRSILGIWTTCPSRNVQRRLNITTAAENYKDTGGRSGSLDGQRALHKRRVFHKRQGGQTLASCGSAGVAVRASERWETKELLKPFERDQLIFAVRRALECHRLKLE